MDALVSAARQAARAETALHDVVAAARVAGVSWAVIGAGLGMTRQAAQKRFSRPAPGRLV
jgi:dihydroxyacetone kinase